MPLQRDTEKYRAVYIHLNHLRTSACLYMPLSLLFRSVQGPGGERCRKSRSLKKEERNLKRL